jgi:hypothetical protein
MENVNEEKVENSQRATLAHLGECESKEIGKFGSCLKKSQN